MISTRFDLIFDAKINSRGVDRYHFICFVQGHNGHLYELEGGANGPIDRGALNDSEDMLSERALALGVRRFVDAAKGNIEFSLVALATKPE